MIAALAITAYLAVGAAVVYGVWKSGELRDPGTDVEAGALILILVALWPVVAFLVVLTLLGRKVRRG